MLSWAGCAARGMKMATRNPKRRNRIKLTGGVMGPFLLFSILLLSLVVFRFPDFPHTEASGVFVPQAGFVGGGEEFRISPKSENPGPRFDGGAFEKHHHFVFLGGEAVGSEGEGKVLGVFSVEKVVFFPGIFEEESLKTGVFGVHKEGLFLRGGVVDGYRREEAKEKRLPERSGRDHFHRREHHRLSLEVKAMLTESSPQEVFDDFLFWSSKEEGKTMAEAEFPRMRTPFIEDARKREEFESPFLVRKSPVVEVRR